MGMENFLLDGKEAAEVKLPGAEADIDVRLIDVKKLDRPLYDAEHNQDKGVTREEGESILRPEWTEEEKLQCQIESGWPDSIVDATRSVEEYEVYKEAGLQESEVLGRPCLIRNDIDGDRIDSMGRTNKERMELGLSPLTSEGKPLELHHIGQKADSPLAELTMEEHRGKGNDRILHDKKIESEIDRNAFNIEKAEHWKNRAEAFN
ncbi:HNH/ENDO VII family nuclease [Paenibacillus sp.]|uniref:HNH/ENDO VII family nuclease n=1 Tax=Paenibacillus sp. TaxID=58172 RepID=UPI0028A6213F|nr:HNH/ENDO VII family nuclease [Paenibacillus sp.]